VSETDIVAEARVEIAILKAEAKVEIATFKAEAKAEMLAWIATFNAGRVVAAGAADAAAKAAAIASTSHTSAKSVTDYVPEQSLKYRADDIHGAGASALAGTGTEFASAHSGTG
jgi:hypothetical protein